MIIAEISLIWRREAGGIFNMLGTTDFATCPDNHHLPLDVDLSIEQKGDSYFPFE